MKWTICDARSKFENYAKLWDETNSASANHILLSSGFVGGLIRHFSDSSSVLLAVRDDSNEPVLMLIERTALQSWSTFQPAQAPLGLIVSTGAVSTRVFLSLMKKLPGFPLYFGVLCQDPELSQLALEGACCEKVPSITTARVSITGSFDEYWSNRPKDLTSNVARRVRKLDREGIALSLQVHEQPGLMTEQISEYGLLESSGWKGKQGTAVAPGNAQGKFYQEILERFSEAGEAAVFTLNFNDEVVASQLCVRRADTLVMLKMAYNEEYRKFAPGYLLRAKLLETVFAEGQIARVEFYGMVREGWTLKWTEEVRSLFHANVFRSLWIKALRKALKQSYGAITGRK